MDIPASSNIEFLTELPDLTQVSSLKRARSPRGALVRRILDDLRLHKPNARIEGASARDQIADRLATLLASADPLPVLGQVASTAYVSLKPNNAYVEHGTGAKLQYLVGIAIAAPRRGIQLCTSAVIQECIDGVDDIFDIERGLLRERIRAGELTMEQALLQEERLLDRFQGYESHIAPILAEVFEPIAALSRGVFGWSPADLVALVDGIRSRVQSKFDDFRAFLLRQHPAKTTFTPDSHALLEALPRLSSALYIHTAEEIANTCGLPEHEVRSALSSMSVKFGDQPHFRLPTEQSQCRHYPVLALKDDQFMIPTTSLLYQEVFEWFMAEAKRRAATHLLEAFYRSRALATEVLTRNALGRVFGKHRVLGPLYYDLEDGEQAEIDAIVTLPGDAILVECKAHTLSPAGRRGAPGRVATKTRELISTPLYQGHRCASRLRAGEVPRTGAGEPSTMAVSASSTLPVVAVTFERIDPLSFGNAEGLSRAPGWVMPLLDLLLITDVLTNPAEFWDYLTIRVCMGVNPLVFAVAEGDILGLYVREGSTVLRQLATTSEQPFMIGPWAQDINARFMREFPRHPAPSVKTKVPHEVVGALASAIDTEPRWSELVEVVLAQPDRSWTRLRGVIRKVRRTGVRGSVRYVDCVEPALRFAVTTDVHSTIDSADHACCLAVIV